MHYILDFFFNYAYYSTHSIIKYKIQSVLNGLEVIRMGIAQWQKSGCFFRMLFFSNATFDSILTLSSSTQVRNSEKCNL